MEISARYPLTQRPTRRSVKTPPPQSPQADPLQGAYQRALARFGNIPGVEIQVCQSAGNGRAPVVVLRHREGQNGTVHVHFHGDQLYDQEVNYEGQIGPCVERAWNAHRDTIFVLPEAANEDKAPRSDWNNVSDAPRIVQDALAKFNLDPAAVKNWTLSGHSAGGSVLAKCIARKSVGKFQRIELYDAAVSSTHNPVSDSEREKIKGWCKKYPEQFLIVPGVMKSSWLEYVDRSRWTEKARDHWSPLWDSLGQVRSPK